MQSSWLYHLSSLTITSCVTLLMVAFYIWGYQLKMKKIRKHPEYSDEGFGASYRVPYWVCWLYYYPSPSVCPVPGTITGMK